MMTLFTLLLGLILGWLTKYLLDHFLAYKEQEHEPPPDDIHASVKHWLRQNNQLKTQLKQQKAINENCTKQLQQQNLELDNFADELHQRDTTIGAYKKTLAIKLQEMEKLQARQMRHDDITSRLHQQLKQREQALLQQQTTYHTTVNQFDAERKEQQKNLDMLKAQAQLTQTVSTQHSVQNSAHNSTQHTQPVQKTVPDDIKRIKGIGPKLAEVFHEHGVNNFKDLADTSPDSIREWLDAAGSRFKLTTDNAIDDWLIQAKLAVEQRWNAFDAFGKRPANTTKASAERSNLTKIWGIGKKLETLLNEQSIHTYQQLMSASAETLTDIIEASHSYYPDSDNEAIFSAWQHQAELADNQQWGQLRGYQQHYRDLRSQHSKSSPDQRRGINLKSEHKPKQTPENSEPSSNPQL